MSLSSQVDALAGRVADEFNTVRGEVTARFVAVDIRDHFAPGRVEGTTNDAPAVTAALAALPAEGGVLIVGREKLRLTGAVTWNKPVTVRGAHREHARITVAANSRFIAAADHVTFENLHIDGTGAQYLQLFDGGLTSGAWTGWRFHHCKITRVVLAFRAVGRPVVPGSSPATTGTGHAADVQLVDVEVSGVESSYAVEVGGIAGFVMDRCWVHDNGIDTDDGEGVKILAGSSAYRIVGCRFNNNTRDGVDAYDSLNGTFVGCDFHDNGVKGLEVKFAETDGHPVDRMVVVGNKAWGNASTGINISAPLSTVVGNTCWENGQYGIRIGAPADNPTTGVTPRSIVADNVVYDNVSTGIVLADGATDVVCSNNQSHHNTAFGISLAARTSGCVLVGNEAFDNDGGRGISVAGDRHQMWGNRTQDDDGDAYVEATATRIVRNGYGVEAAAALATPTAADWPVGVEVRNTTDGKRWRRRPGGWDNPLAGMHTMLFTPGRYYTPISEARTTSAIINGAGALCAIPFWVGARVTFDRIGLEVTVAVAASAARLGIYTDTGGGSPKDLVVDAGTVDTSTTGAKELTINVTVEPGLYWLAVVSQGGSPTYRALNGTLAPVGAGTTIAMATTAGGIFACLQTAAAAVTGALPASFPAITTFAAFPPVVAVRAA